MTRLVSNAFSKTLVKKIRLGGIVLENETNNDSSVLLVSPELNRRVDRGQTQLSRARKRHTCIVKIANLHSGIIGVFKRNIVVFVSSIDVFDWPFQDSYLYKKQIILIVRSPHLPMVFTRKRKLKFAKKIVEKQQNVVKPAASDLERNILLSLY